MILVVILMVGQVQASIDTSWSAGALVPAQRGPVLAVRGELFLLEQDHG